jgi:hypothetical protein
LDECRGCCLLIVGVPLLCLALAACALLYVATAGADPPLSDKFVATSADAQAFDRQIDSAVNDARLSGGFTLTFSEREISSWMALEGEAFGKDYVGAFPVDNIQVGLDDGEMRFYGELGRLDLPILITVKPGVDRIGHLDFEIVELNLGGVGLPGGMLDSVSDQLKDKIRSPLEDLEGDYVLDPASLSVTNGRFAVRGQVFR